MQTIINAMRIIIGTPNFYKQLGSYDSYSWDYGAMIEYFCACLILLIVISSVFRIFVNLFKK